MKIVKASFVILAAYFLLACFSGSVYAESESIKKFKKVYNISDADVNSYLTKLKKENPGVYDNYMNMKKSNPDMFERMIMLNLFSAKISEMQLTGQLTSENISKNKKLYNISDQDIKVALNKLRVNDPNQYKTLMELKAKDPVQYENQVMNLVLQDRTKGMDLPPVGN